MNATEARRQLEEADKAYEQAADLHVALILHIEDACTHLDENGDSAIRFVKGLERECVGCRVPL